MTSHRPLVAVVDDDESVSRSTGRLLRSVGIDSESFPSGNAFLQKRAATPSFHPDCVVLDVQMPGLNGLEVQQRLAGSGLPVIFITAHDETGVRELALAAGAVAFLHKPFDDEIFIGAVNAAVRPAAVPNKV